MAVRVNLRRTSIERAEAELAAAGCGTRRLENDALLLERALPVARLPGYAEGRLSVQDAGAQWAARLLDPQPGERVADMFCGLGNFSLPIARRGADVTGIEGSEALVRRATENAATNGLSDRARFEVRDLFQITSEDIAKLGAFDKMLIDPPRDGAMALVKALEAALPKRIVYVSCSPATLARDAGVLVNVHGYRLTAAGVVNMFPHTGHVESIALFDR